MNLDLVFYFGTGSTVTVTTAVKRQNYLCPLRSGCYDFNKILSSCATMAAATNSFHHPFSPFILSFSHRCNQFKYAQFNFASLHFFLFGTLFCCSTIVCVCDRFSVRHSFGALKSKVFWVIHRSNKFSLQRPQPARVLRTACAIGRHPKVSPLFEMNLIILSLLFLFALYG